MEEKNLTPLRVPPREKIAVRSLMDLRGILLKDDTVPIRDKTDRFDP